MKNLLLLFISCFLSLYVSGQELRIVEINHEKYNLSNYSFFEKAYLFLDLESDDPFKSHIRITLDAQIYDFFSWDNKIFEGILTNFVTTEKSFKKKDTCIRNYFEDKIDKFYFQNICLNTDSCTKFVKSFLKSKQHLISQDYIKNFYKGFSCCYGPNFYSYFQLDTKIVNQEIYCFNDFEKGSPLQKIFYNNHLKLKSTFSGDSLFKEFVNFLPKGNSYYLSSIHTLYSPTKQDERKWKRKSRRYHAKFGRTNLKNDSLFNYLTDEINEILPKIKDLNYFKEYKLIYSKNGKLRKIVEKSSRKFKYRYDLYSYFENKYFMWLEKRKLKKAFKNIKTDIIKKDINIL